MIKILNIKYICLQSNALDADIIAGNIINRNAVTRNLGRNILFLTHGCTMKTGGFRKSLEFFLILILVKLERKPETKFQKRKNKIKQIKQINVKSHEVKWQNLKIET